jgi:hypothetical protein
MMHAFLQAHVCLLWRLQETSDPPTPEALGKRIPVLRLIRTLRQIPMLIMSLGITEAKIKWMLMTLLQLVSPSLLNLPGSS